MCIFGWIQKCTKKDHDCEEGGLTLSSALLKFLKLPRRQSEIAFFGVKHEKFQSFRSAERPGGHFFKAGRGFLRASGALT